MIAFPFDGRVSDNVHPGGNSAVTWHRYKGRRRSQLKVLLGYVKFRLHSLPSVDALPTMCSLYDSAKAWQQ